MYEENYGMDISLIDSITFKYFEILDSYMYSGYYRYIISYDNDFKEKFYKYNRELKKNGYVAIADKRPDNSIELTIRTYPFVHSSPSRKPMILFLITLAFIFIDAYFRSYSVILSELVPGYNPLATALLYGIGLISVIGIHELGHLIMIRKYGVDASLPYFIPGIPVFGLPTFGAVISQREPPNDRDALFDIGLAGPIAGLIPTILIMLYSIPSTPVLSQAEIAHLVEKYHVSLTPIPTPWLYIKILSLFKYIGPNDTVILPPLAFVALIGFLITGLNLIPAWQLDGGHLARALFGEETHRWITFIAIGLLFLIGFIPFAMLILIFYFLTGGRSVRPLNDITPLSTSRKIIYAVSLILGILMLPLPLRI